MSNRFAAHTLVRGFPVEHFLRHLMVNPASSSHTRDLAHAVLVNGDVNAFHPLQDSLADDGHPLAGHYNLPNAAYKLPLDHALRDALRPYVDSLTARYATGTDNAHRFAHFAAVGHVDHYLETPSGHRHSHWLEPLGRDAVATVKRQFPDATDSMLRESLDRLGTHAWNAYTAGDADADEREREFAAESLAPVSDYEGHSLHRAVSASRYRRERDPVGEAFNAEFRKLADRLNAVDKNHFNAQNHFGYLMRVAGGNGDLAHDMATYLLYGKDGDSPIGRNYDGGRPLWIRFRGQAAMLPKYFANAAKETRSKRFAGTFTDALPGKRNDDEGVREIIDPRADDPADIAAADDDFRMPSAGRTPAQDAWRKRQPELSDEHHVGRIRTVLAKYPQGVPLTKLADYLRVGDGDRVRDLIAKSGAAVATRKTLGKPVTTVHPAGTVLAESGVGPSRPRRIPADRRELLSQVLAMKKAGLSFQQIGGRLNRSKQAVAGMVKTATKHGVEAASKYARVEAHHVLGGRVDPLLRGTRLAYHLQEMKQSGDESLAALAERALRGRWHSAGTDVFKELGLALKHRGSELASAYNWHRAADSLYTDAVVKEFIDSVAHPSLGSHRYRTAAKRFGLGTGTGGDAKTSAFWDAMRKHAKARNASGVGIKSERLSDAMLDRSLRRLAYREEDTHEIEQSKSSRQRVDRPVPETPTAMGNRVTEHPWRTYMKFLPGTNSAERYSRLDQLKRFVNKQLGRVRDLPHSEYDGVLYRGRGADGGLDADGYPKVLAERAAVTHALHRLGYVTADPAENRRLVNKYTRYASRLALLRPDHPVVAHYRAAASQVNVPAVVANPENPAQLMTVASTGPAGKELGQAAVPLVRFVTHLFPEPKRGHHHWSLTGPADTAPEVDAHDATPEEAPEYVPAVKPAGDDKPIPVAKVRREKGAGGLRHTFIAEMEARGYAKPAVVAAMKHEFLVSHREATATYTGYRRAKRKPTVTVPPPREHDEPLRLSRQPVHESTFVEALRRLRSGQQDHLRKIAETVHRALGLTPTAVRDALHDSPTRSINSVVHSITHPNDHATVMYGASQFGLIAQQPGLMVFHVGDGPDSVYKVKTTGTGEQIRESLDRHGIPQRTLLPTPTGFDCLLPDPGRRLRERVHAFASEQRGSVYESTGTAVILGDGQGSKADAESRKSYRSVIEHYESGTAK